MIRPEFRFSFKWGKKEKPDSVIEFSVSSYCLWIAMERAKQSIKDSGRDPETGNISWWEVK